MVFVRRSVQFVSSIYSAVIEQRQSTTYVQGKNWISASITLATVECKPFEALQIW